MLPMLNPTPIAFLARRLQSRAGTQAHCPRPCRCAAGGDALSRGEFLDGFYDDWVLSERDRLRACTAMRWQGRWLRGRRW